MKFPKWLFVNEERVVLFYGEERIPLFADEGWFELRLNALKRVRVTVQTLLNSVVHLITALSGGVKTASNSGPSATRRTNFPDSV
jgi:hypothetical protein